MDVREPVLFIAFQFPPQAGPGVYRSIRFVQHLRHFGYEPIVLTRDIRSIEKGAYPLDKSLEQMIPQGIRIIRTVSKEKTLIRKWLIRVKLYGLFWYVFYRWLWEPSLYWSRHSVTAALNEIKQKNIRIVYTSSAPFSALLLGHRLKRKAGVKWVADLRDPWCDAFTWQWPSAVHHRWTQKLEKRLLNKADRIIVVTTEMKNLLLKKGIGNEQNIEVIFNGFG